MTYEILVIIIWTAVAFATGLAGATAYREIRLEGHRDAHDAGGKRVLYYEECHVCRIERDSND